MSLTEADKSAIELAIISKQLMNEPFAKSLTVESPWKSALFVIAGSALVKCKSDNAVVVCSGFRDLHIIEFILKRWNKKFSWKLRGNNAQRMKFRLQAEVLEHVIDCLEWLMGDGLSKEEAREIFIGIFYEAALTPFGSEAEITHRETIKIFQSQNRRLMKVDDAFENPFDKELTPYTYRFTEICDVRSGQADKFCKQRWYPLVRARKAWTTFYIEKGSCITFDHKKNKITSDNRGRSKSKK